MECQICQTNPAIFKCSCSCQLFLCGSHCQKKSHDETPFYQDFSENKEFRKVLFTNGLQLVSMYLKPYETIPMETHPTTTQVFYIEYGEGEAEIEGIIYKLKPKVWLTVPAGLKHEIRAYKEGLGLKTIYSKPEH
jgi:quercetin dioxygenase-like cupin family protein